jgi:hypothetical protein
MLFQSFFDRKRSSMPHSALMHGRIIIPHPNFRSDTLGSFVNYALDLLTESSTGLPDPDFEVPIGKVCVDARPISRIVGDRQLKLIDRLTEVGLNVLPILTSGKEDVTLHFDSR